ncbi:MAG TPA: hypothetical protein VLK25_13825 [Allosphingosinicella sp.]|nr:hypothetical protein [Allosphingosinicella sp.]
MLVFISFAFAAAAIEPPAAQPSQASERICRGGGTRTLGSHMRSRRRCLTAEQWQREDEARNNPAPGAQITGAQNDGRTGAMPR